MSDPMNMAMTQSNKLMLDKQQVQRQFDRSASVYDNLAGMQEEMAIQLLDNIPPDVLGKASSIVDLGCGTGVVLQHLQKRIKHTDLYALDLAEGMLQQAKLTEPSVCYQQGDMVALPYADNSFDVVLSNASLQWCDLNNALAEIVRVSKPGAGVYFSTFLSGTLHQWRQQWMTEAERQQHRLLSSDNVIATLSDFPLAETSIKQMQWLQPFDNLSDAVKSISHLGAGNASVSRNGGLLGRQRYQQIQQWFNLQKDSQGKVNLPYEVAFVSASITE